MVVDIDEVDLGAQFEFVLGDEEVMAGIFGEDAQMGDFDVFADGDGRELFGEEVYAQDVLGVALFVEEEVVVDGFDVCEVELHGEGLALSVALDVEGQGFEPR